MWRKKGIVITGLGIVSPFGYDQEDFWKKIEKGASAFRRVDSFNIKYLRAKKAAFIHDHRLKSVLDKDAYRISRSASLAYLAARITLKDSGFLINSGTVDQIGICVATTLSNIGCFAKLVKQLEKGGVINMDPSLLPYSLLNAPASFVAIKLNLQGFNTTISTGFTASIDAIEYAVNLISSGRVKAALVIGVEEVTSYSFSAFEALGLLAGVYGQEVCCPFDKRRNGFMLGEAAVGLLIEDESYARERKAKIYAKIEGIGLCFDPVNSKGRASCGNILSTSMAMAMDRAGTGISDIDYISAAANSSVDYDRFEILAIKKVFGKAADKIPVSAIKSILGETISASGAIQIASAIGMMKRGVIPPTLNYKFKDHECSLNSICAEAVNKRIKTALINNFCSLGSGASIIISVQ